MPTPSLSTVGQRYRDFIVTKSQPIKELQCHLCELLHEPSGASVMHIENDDPENLFCISFQTLPSSSNGAPHVLEHTVLCGSRKFPVKDPFFAMTRRSLNTFMNALTGSDFTCYPAASQVEKDFYNLFEVYLDAVFQPNLNELSFLQEGHRLEFTIPDDPTSPLEHKGIVFNEMKGSLNSSESRLWHAMLECLTPDLPYAYNSGGDPKVIPKLSYAELVAFHKTYYHPSRSLFFFYGNLPLERHLDFISERTLKNVVKLPPLPPIPLQPRFSKPHSMQMRYPINEGEDLKDKAIIAFGWLTTAQINQEELLALSVLDSILMETDASLLKLKLFQSGLCIQADAFMDAEMSEVPYVIVCKGCDEKNVDKLEELLLTSIEEIAKTGIPMHLIEAAIHQLEFNRLEIAGDHAPFGLTLFMRSALAKQHGCSPEHALMVHSLFEKLLQDVKDPAYLPGLLRKYFLSNPHRVRIAMTADPQLSSQELSEEKKELEQIRTSLYDDQVKAILAQAKELATYQKKTEKQSIECLPKVALSDIPANCRDFALLKEQIGGLHLFQHDCFTNQILYADLAFDLPEIAPEDLPLAQLFVSILTEVGTGKRDYAANLGYMQEHTGGVSAGFSLHVQMGDAGKIKPSLLIRGKALHRKADKLLTLMKEIVTEPRFDEKKRIEELIMQTHTSLINRFNRNALKYAIQLSLSGFSIPSHIYNSWYGLDFYKAIETLSKNLSTELPKLIEKLLFFKEALLCKGEPHLVLSCDQEILARLKDERFFGLCDLKTKACAPWKGDLSLSPLPSQARAIASPVAFTAEAYQSVTYLHPHASALAAATQIFDNQILHPRIREQGGAYGAGASFNSSAGSFTFHSYRDPHIAKTIKTFHLAVETIAKGSFSERDLEEAKFGIVQHLDIPTSPGNRAAVAYNWWREGKTREHRQRHRERLLALTPKEVTEAVADELLPKIGSGIVVSFAGKELIEQENALLAKKGKPLALLPI